MFGFIADGWQEWQKARLIAKSATLNENEAHDLVFLHKQGFVRARATGQSITCIYSEIENLIDKRLRVTINPGTYFVAKGNHQNMVARKEITVVVPPLLTKQLLIDAACINANLTIPREKR